MISRTSYINELRKMESWLKEGSPQFSMKLPRRQKYITVVMLRRFIDDDKDLIYCIYETTFNETIKPFGYYIKKQNQFVCVFDDFMDYLSFTFKMQVEAAEELDYFFTYKGMVDAFLRDWGSALKEYFGVVHINEVLEQQKSRKKDDYTDYLDGLYIRGEALPPYEKWLKRLVVHETSPHEEDRHMDNDFLWRYMASGGTKEVLSHMLDEQNVISRVNYTKMAGKMGVDIFAIKNAIGRYFNKKEQWEAYKPSLLVKTAKTIRDAVIQATDGEDKLLVVETEKGIYHVWASCISEEARVGFSFRTAKLIERKGKSKITSFDVTDVLKISMDNTIVYEK